MIQAAINPETGEFLGLIVPAADLKGNPITIHGTAADWAAATMGEHVDPSKIAVLIGTNPRDLTAEPIEKIEIDNLCPPGGQES